MRKLLLGVALIASFSMTAQYYSITYVSVASEDIEEFERKETTYWSKVKKQNIDNGKQIFWGLMRKVGTAGNNEVNYAFVNVFPSMEDMLNTSWNPESLGFDVQDAISPYTVFEIHNYKVLDQIPGQGGKYSVWNYARPKNLNGFIKENQDLWKPFMEKSIKKGNTGMTDWGIGARLYPKGQNESTVMTWDGYKSLIDAMNALDETDFTPPAKSKMDEYDPDGFRLRVIWEQVKAVQ